MGCRCKGADTCHKFGFSASRRVPDVWRLYADSLEGTLCHSADGVRFCIWIVRKKALQYLVSLIQVPARGPVAEWPGWSKSVPGKCVPQDAVSALTQGFPNHLC